MEWLMLMWIWPRLYPDDKKKSKSKQTGQEFHDVLNTIRAVHMTMMIMSAIGILLMIITIVQILL